MGTKISALPVATTGANADQTAIVQGGVTKRVALQSLLYGVSPYVGDSIVFGADQDTYITRSNANEISFYVGGNQHFRFTDDGALQTGGAADAGYHHLKIDKAGSNALRVENTSATDPSVILSWLSGASPDNNTSFFLQCSDSTTSRCFIYSDGDLQNHDNSYGAISDERLKQDIADASLQSQYDDIKALRLRKYRFKSDVTAATEDRPAVFHLGVIAQEAAEVSPGLVQVGEDGMYGVQYSVLYLKAIGALQRVMQMVEDHDGRLSALEAA